MKTLDEHNDERRRERESLRRAQDPHPNGIECPECKAELWDSNPTMLLTSNPPQKNVHCPQCKWRGYRVA
jgi:transcription elongation factor Elf1